MKAHQPKNQRLLKVSHPLRRHDIVLVVLALLIVGHSFYTYMLTSFNQVVYDETTFMAFGSTLVKDAVAKGDFSSRIWYEDPTHCGSSNPRVGVFILGAMSIIFPFNSIESMWKIRLFAAVIALLTVVVFYRTLALTIKPWFAVAGGVLFALHPVYRWVHVSLITDVMMLLFSLLALYFAVHVIAASDDDKKLPNYWLATAVFVGLAVSTKLYALGIGVMCAYLIFHQWRHRGKQALAYGLVMLIIIAFIFVATNPLLWWDPWFGLKQMTTDHMVFNSEGYITIAHAEVLLRHTFTFFSTEHYPQLHEVGTMHDWWVCVPGLLLTVLSIGRRRNRFFGLWMSFFLGYLVCTFWVVISLVLTWYTPKLALGPAAGMTALVAYTLSWLFETFQKIVWRNVLRKPTG